MRAVVQRVSFSSVEWEGKKNEIGRGFNVLLGVGEKDNSTDAKYIVEKIINLRVFSDENDKMNLSLRDIGGEVLLISQFTLFGDVRHGRRPSFISAAPFESGKALYEEAAQLFEEQGIKVKCGFYGEDMRLTIVNEGPVSILIDSKKTF